MQSLHLPNRFYLLQVLEGSRPEFQDRSLNKIKKYCSTTFRPVRRLCNYWHLTMLPTAATVKMNSILALIQKTLPCWNFQFSQVIFKVSCWTSQPHGVALSIFLIARRARQTESLDYAAGLIINWKNHSHSMNCWHALNRSFAVHLIWLNSQ